MQVAPINTLQSWLTARLAEALGLSSEAVDVQKSFTEYGLDSIAGVFLAGDLEHWLGLKLSATVLWEYPTVETLAQYLATELQRQGVAGTRPEGTCQPNRHDISLDPQEDAQLLASLDALSDEEVNRLLGNLLTTQVKAR